jgi:hypothetical protein
LLPEKLRALFAPKASPSPAAESPRAAQPAPIVNRDEVITRPSRALEQFFTHIRDQSGLNILDLGGANQDNVSFITNLGHRLYSESFIRTLRDTFGTEDPNEQGNSGQMEQFLAQNLDYPEQHFDGVLIWDVLEYLGPALLAITIDRLHRIVRPGSYLMAFFHSGDKLAEVPYYSFRIRDANLLQVTQRGGRQPAQLFNNRSLERLFENFESVKFFLTKERLREVVIKR